MLCFRSIFSVIMNVIQKNMYTKGTRLIKANVFEHVFEKISQTDFEICLNKLKKNCYQYLETRICDVFFLKTHSGYLIITFLNIFFFVNVFILS